MIKFFLVLVLLVHFGCQKEEEELLDLDEMVDSEEEIDANHLAGEPIPSPQEVPAQDPE